MRYLVTSLLLGVVFAASGFSQGQTPATPPPAPSLSVEVEICTAVVDRAPAGTATSFGADVGTLYCWSKITGAAGETTIKHIWMYEGKKMAVVDLPVKSNYWRTHSSKKILPEWTGNWEVQVVDAAGDTLKTAAFTVGAAPKQ